MPDAGEPLSPQAADLIRQVARVFLDEPADLMAEVHAAISAAADEPLRSEPTLAAEVAASNRANVLHLAASMLKDPGGRVPANLTPEVLGIAREAFRRGIDQTVYTTYHTGQNIVWAYWMRTAFALSQDPAVLRQALAAGSRSVAGFVEDMVAALSEQLRRERADLARSSHERRFEVVSLILDSAPITTGRASTQLGYELRRRHTSAVLWTDPRRPDQAALAAAAEALGPATRARQVLTVIASSSSVWAWLAAAAADTGAGVIAAATAPHPAVRVAAGPAGAGADGFRRSHFDAVATPAADVPPAGPAGRPVRRCPAGHPARRLAAERRLSVLGDLPGRSLRSWRSATRASDRASGARHGTRGHLSPALWPSDRTRCPEGRCPACGKAACWCEGGTACSGRAGFRPTKRPGSRWDPQTVRRMAIRGPDCLG